MPHRDQRVAMEARLESQGLELARLRDEHARLESEARALRHDLAHAETTLAEGVGAPRRLGRAIVTVVVVLGLLGAAWRAGYVLADHHARARAELVFGATRHLETVVRVVGGPPIAPPCRLRVVSDSIVLSGGDAYSCRVRVWCGDQLLYGTLDASGGFAQCMGARIWDGRIDDGDPALEIDLAEGRVTVDDGSRRIVLEP